MLQLVIGQGLQLAAVGAVLGIGLALVATRGLRELLFEIPHTDPLTYCAAVVIIGGAVFLASYFPARRATRVDPMVALRHE
jgi:ABC-type antimicrobial peptide transport system permease subunit